MQCKNTLGLTNMPLVFCNMSRMEVTVFVPPLLCILHDRKLQALLISKVI